MGISLAMIEKMQNLGLFGKGRISVLDVGSSNLYSASADGISQFLNTHGIVSTPDVNTFAQKLAEGSAYDEVNGGINGAFVGELFEKAGIRYNAIDIADGYRTTILDLNHDSTPPNFIDAFDLVLNFGTTEHLLNQYNAFKVIHDSTKIGGYIVHSLPCVGYSNHGYFTYTPRCLFDLAGYNEYELVGLWFVGPGGNNDLYAPVRDYLTYFPNLSNTLSDREQTETGQKVGGLDLPDVGIMVVYRKVKARPFAGALEKSTSVGNVPTSVTSGYESGGSTGRPPKKPLTTHDNAPNSRIRAFAHRLVRFACKTLRINSEDRSASSLSKVSISEIARHDEISLNGQVQEMRNRFVLQELDYEECLAFYNLVTEAHGYFPYDWEFRVLLLGLEREPTRLDLSERLMAVQSYL